MANTWGIKRPMAGANNLENRKTTTEKIMGYLAMAEVQSAWNSIQPADQGTTRGRDHYWWGRGSHGWLERGQSLPDLRQNPPERMIPLLILLPFLPSAMVRIRPQLNSPAVHHHFPRLRGRFAAIYGRTAQMQTASPARWFHPQSSAW